MSPSSPSETDPSDRNTAIALFRYGLIAQLVHTPPESGQQEQLLREIAARIYTIPGSTLSGRRGGQNLRIPLRVAAGTAGLAPAILIALNRSD